ncbi:MAG: S41 family peptidase [Agriterribacter sp.]
MAKRFKYGLLVVILAQLAFSCRTSQKMYAPSTKLPPQALREDFLVLRELLEKFHPALYWYTSKDSMDYYFDTYYKAINDSMTRQQFGFSILAPITTKIHCGHTSFNYPAKYNRKVEEHTQPSFPLFMKVWPDTMVLTSNLNKDSVLKRGTLITSINGMTEQQLTDTLFQFMPTDGYSENVNYSRLSAAFPYYHRNILGLSKTYEVGYVDSVGTAKTAIVPLFDPSNDSTVKAFIHARNKQVDPRTKLKKWEGIRSLKIDTANKLAVMEINSFTGGRLPCFFKRSFRKIKKQHIPYLVIDIRSNGGGNVSNYTSLTRYLRQTPFKVCDTMISNTNSLGHYKKYFKSGLLNSTILRFVAKKREDNAYHFRYWEKHVFKPRKKNHYNGQVYVLISGPTFSASTLFANAVKGQKNITLVGEEAGGGWYGNSGIRIPDIVLPHSGMKVRLPLFRIVQYNHVSQDGKGVMPDIYVPPSVENIRKSVDGKMKKVLELIKETRN